MRKLIFLFAVLCALSLPTFATAEDGVKTSDKQQLAAETDNKIREMANETYAALIELLGIGG
jgi:hypothetical protein